MTTALATETTLFNGATREALARTDAIEPPMRNHCAYFGTLTNGLRAYKLEVAHIYGGAICGPMSSDRSVTVVFNENGDAIPRAELERLDVPCNGYSNFYVWRMHNGTEWMVRDLLAALAR